MVAASKREAAERLSPAWLRTKRTHGVSEVDPSDYRYRLAVDHPGHVVVTRDNVEFGDPVLVPVEQMQHV